MILFLFISAQAIQFKLTSKEYIHSGTSIKDTLYYTTSIINGEEHKLMIDSTISYSWIYSKNIETNEQCNNCPDNVKLINCNTQPCNIVKNQDKLLSNGDKCKLALINYQTKDYNLQSEQCLVYYVVHSDEKVDGAIGLNNYDQKQTDQLTNGKSSIIAQLENQDKTIRNNQVASIILNKNNPIINYGITEFPAINKQNYENQDNNKWQLLFELYIGQKTTTIKNQIQFDTKTSHLWLLQDQMRKLISQIEESSKIYCQMEQKQIICTCVNANDIAKFPKFYFQFNNQKENHQFLPNIQFIKTKSICQLNIYETENIPKIGTQLFINHQVDFHYHNKSISISDLKDYQVEEIQINSNFRIILIIIGVCLLLIGYCTLINIMKNIGPLSPAAYQQESPKQIYVIPIQKPVKYVKY